ncbi:hypothetical protein PLESTB_001301500 [Pleodorina starrii]|uniref:Uncharacterized protein n=1 Tax=Pleodorina starrii TaxID=330485 RepID=A0A9W6BU75_9CHLO|nr:hypothetical protein PLESTM_000859200 [Pleodorina starrii]GLC57980.1 hypothetical protein PLESTB_001301300 [Pleodorina starrii]GLC57982.1 hypothetical protein PLESTB_001301500 [Pleodorina starrii]GLC76778.1 hypothetical protein PLESTF_001832900 [Pleodorina starrii]GLC76780.1 hypothetical protein PLESTF_001833100 [Pleodorina starrii]
MEHMWTKYASADSPIQRLSLLRDTLCCQFMWHTSYRGGNTGKLRLMDFRDPVRGGPFRGFPLPSPDPSGSYPPITLRVEMVGTKTSKGRRAPPKTLTVDSEPKHCFVRTLALFWASSHAPDAPPGSAITDYFFRPLDPSHQRFEAGPLSSQALSMRVHKHLKDSGLYDGETPHGFRRGAIQAFAATGATDQELLEFAQLKSKTNLELYTDTTRRTRAPAQAPAPPT